MEIIFENNEIKVERSTYNNGRPRLELIDKVDNYHQNISVNPDWLKVNTKQVIVRNYGETEGIYDFLVQNEIVSTSKGNVTIGKNTALTCKIL